MCSYLCTFIESRVMSGVHLSANFPDTFSFVGLLLFLCLKDKSFEAADIQRQTVRTGIAEKNDLPFFTFVYCALILRQYII